MRDAAARKEGGAGIGNTAAQEQSVLIEATIVLRQLVQECRRFASRHHVAMAQGNELGCASRAGSAENESDVIGACGRRERVMLDRRKVERDVARRICIPSGSDLDQRQPQRARNLANGPVEPRIDDDGLDATSIEMAPELVCRLLAADRDSD
jgi:hypothetical protein